jgi:tRNA dimethylallyltransferase
MRAVIIEGPTGVGKSQVSFALALALQSAIVVADSIQIFSKFNIAANKPTSTMQRAIPYHLLSHYDPKAFSLTNPLTVWRYRSDALAALRKVWERGQVPVLEGGSHFYLKCLLYGIEDAGAVTIPEAVRTKVRSLVKEYRDDWETCVARMKMEIPEIELDFQKNDFYRLEKAGILALIGKRSDRVLFTEKPQFDARVFYLDLDNSSLNRANTQRCERLVEQGLVEETIALLASGDFSCSEADWKLPENSIGYAETFRYLQKLDVLMSRDGLRDEELVSVFYEYLEGFIASTRKCVKSQRKTFRLSSSTVTYVPLSLDSFNQLPLADVVQRILHLAALPRENYETYVGADPSLFSLRPELEPRIQWSIYPRDTLHPARALTAVYRHLKQLSLHRDQLAAHGFPSNARR